MKSSRSVGADIEMDGKRKKETGRLAAGQEKFRMKNQTPTKREPIEQEDDNSYEFGNHNRSRDLIQKLLTCPLHNHAYLYLCTHPDCQQLLCGKIACVDLHFHNHNHLTIDKLDPKLLTLSLNYLNRFAAQYRQITQELNHLMTRVSDMTLQSELGLSYLSQMEELNQYLADNQSQPLTLEFIESIQAVIGLGHNIQSQLQELQDNFRPQHFTRLEEISLVQMLRQEFKELEQLSFNELMLSESILQRRQQLVDELIEPNEGLLTAAISEDQSIILGEFFSNLNVETGELFLPSFLFILKPNGLTRKYPIEGSVLKIVSKENDKTLSSEMFVEVSKEDVNVSEQSPLASAVKIGKILTFLCQVLK